MMKPVNPILIFLVLAAAGCAGKPVRVPVVPTRGSALLDDKPAAGALLIFHPAAGDLGLPANPRARVLADGSFVVETYDTGDGAPAGEYAVTVAWRTQSSAEGDGEEVSEESLVPALYTSPDSSPLKVQVVPGPDGKCELLPIRIVP